MTRPGSKVKHLLGAALKDKLDVLALLDLGASEADGAGPPVYSPLADLACTTIYCFEPHASEHSKLKDHAGQRIIFSDAVADGEMHVFRSTNVPMTSSLLEPNTEYLRYFENLAELCLVQSRISIATKRLDDLDIPNIDLMKIDVQGATMMVLGGAKRALMSTLVVHTEVEFSPIYQGGAFFSEVDTALRSAGFAFHHFHALEGRRVLAGQSAFGTRASRTLWGDAVYVPDFARFAKLTKRDLVALAVIAHDCYDACDLAALCLNRYDNLTGEGLEEWYRSFAAS